MIIASSKVKLAPTTKAKAMKAKMTQMTQDNQQITIQSRDELWRAEEARLLSELDRPSLRSSLSPKNDISN